MRQDRSFMVAGWIALAVAVLTTRGRSWWPPSALPG